MKRPALLAVSVAIVSAIALGLYDSARAAQDRKVALVFGNSAYASVPRLTNPATDGAAMSAMLQKAGFDVTSRQDATVAEMRKALRDFSTKVSGADEVVVFYAGHGIEVDGTNYLIPIDAKLERDTDVEDEAVALDRIVRLIEPAKRLRLVILDACRDNPFSSKMTRSLSRGVQRGLAKVEPTSPNTLIAYAAKAGSTASDGDGTNSPFTTALLKQLPMPGQDLRKSLGYVRDTVLKATGNKQEPYVYGSLGGDDVVLVSAASGVASEIAALDLKSRLRRDYELAAQVNTQSAWDAFLKSYPKGFYAELARAARGKLDTQTAAVTTPGEMRALPGVAPQPQSQPAPSVDVDVASLVGKTLRVVLSLRQVQASPEPGKVLRVGREIALYVKSPTEITSRFTDRPGTPQNSRFARAAPGAVDRGIQILAEESHLLMIVQFNSYRLKVAMTPQGNTCKADAAYELQTGVDHYKLFRTGTQEPLLMSEMKVESANCWVTASDEVGQPPVAAVKPN